MSRDSPNTGGDTPVQVVSNTELDSLISDDELVECFNIFQAKTTSSCNEQSDWSEVWT